MATKPTAARSRKTSTTTTATAEAPAAPAKSVAAAPASKAAPAAKTTPAAKPVAATPITDKLIAERAYYLWLERGRPQGCDAEIWFQAVRELTHTKAA